MHHHLQNAFHVQLARISQLLDRLAVWHVPQASLSRKSDLTRLLVMLARRARTKIYQAKAFAVRALEGTTALVPTYALHVLCVVVVNTVERKLMDVLCAELDRPLTS